MCDLYVYMYVCMYLCVYMFIYIHMYMYIYIYIHLSTARPYTVGSSQFLFAYVHLYVCMYIYTHTHTYTRLVHIGGIPSVCLCVCVCVVPVKVHSSTHKTIILKYLGHAHAFHTSYTLHPFSLFQCVLAYFP